jgi:hypothetical protein
MNSPVAQNMLRTAIDLLVLSTAGIHLLTGVQMAAQGMLPLFAANAAGYVTLGTALYLPLLRRFRDLVRWALLGYTTLTVVLWVVMGARTPIAYVDKVIELVLIALLLMDRRSEARSVAIEHRGAKEQQTYR